MIASDFDHSSVLYVTKLSSAPIFGGAVPKEKSNTDCFRSDYYLLRFLLKISVTSHARERSGFKSWHRP